MTRQAGLEAELRADSPADVPARDWKAILLGVGKEFNQDQIPLIAAGVTFYMVLALFPALAAFVSVYGLASDPGQVGVQLHRLSHVLPGGAVTVIGGQLAELAKAKPSGLSLGFLVGVLTAIWSANGAAGAIVTGLNIAYEAKERRGFIRRTATSLAITVAMLAFAALAVILLGLASSAGHFIGPHGALIANLISWPTIVIILAIGLALLYRFGPCRRSVRLRWITPGAAAVVIVWVIVSAIFSAYVANFGHYNKTYGSLGAAVGFMTWLWLSSMLLLAGAELNAEIEGAARP
ncbi:MAG TPA: YihY/virulence factor BrkB family protein [Caulobacteraceae bacterium]|nr:YihY/virulence factor BrkB family protein [Caulobacteraceae bacterium]